jgi:hypothetical protein
MHGARGKLRITIRTGPELALGLALGLVLASGCGGGDEGRGSESASGVPVTVTATATATATGTDGGSGSGGSGASGSGGSASVDGTAEGEPVFDVGTLVDAAPGEDCVPPDLLVVLDRSQSMHRTPAGDTPTNDMAGYQSSRWWIAIEALEAFAVTFEAGIALGLELFPEVSPMGCVTLAERIAGTGATDDGCNTSELVFAPAVGTAGDFDMALDPLTTLMCNQTPISTAIENAGPVLAGLAGPDHEQFVVLLTDGGESCGGDFTARVQELVASTGARVYVVAFGDTALTAEHQGLNRMACAGQTAAGFPAPCVDDGMGNYDAVDPAGATLYIPAEDGQALVDAFDGIATELCCGASCPVG